MIGQARRLGRQRVQVCAIDGPVEIAPQAVQAGQHGRVFQQVAHAQRTGVAEAQTHKLVVGAVQAQLFGQRGDDEEEWEIEIDEKRPRPTGAVSGHHVDDLVLRATRHTC